MERKVQRAQKALDRLESQIGLTETGKEWLITSLDPFHDFAITPTGYPDGEVGSSIVQCFKGSTTVNRPLSVPDTDNWDCLITTDNVVAPTQYTSMENVNNLYATDTGRINVSAYSGGLTIGSGPTGSSELYVIDTTATQPHGVTSIGIPSSYYQDRMRVVACGFEVHNVTSELYKQGSICCFQQPCPSALSTQAWGRVNNLSGGNVLQAISNVCLSSHPPNTFSEAVLLPGSKIWEAKDGAYVVACQNTLDNPSKHPEFITPAMTNAPFYNTYPSANLKDTYVGTTLPIIAGNYASSGLCHLAPYDRKGCYMTGLSPETSLTVNYNCYVERFPDVESTLLTLAKPSPPRDKVALQVYSELMTQLPVGVPVKENGLGDWFTGAVAGIIDDFTGTKFASGIDKWQKEKFSPSPDTHSFPHYTQEQLRRFEAIDRAQRQQQSEAAKKENVAKLLQKNRTVQPKLLTSPKQPTLLMSSPKTRKPGRTPARTNNNNKL